MARLIIHPGAPKTGTSTLQHFLDAQRDVLRERGVAVFTPGNLRRTAFMADARMAVRGLRPIGKAALDAFMAETDGAETVLISEEGFASRFLVGGRRVPRGLERARRIADVIGGLPFDDIRVILSIRRQRGLLVSVYTHRVKLHRERRSFSRWMTEAVAPERLSWAGVTRRFEAKFGAGKVALLPFEMLKAEGADAYARAFIRSAGLDEDGLDYSRIKAVNLSASRYAVLASRLHNRISAKELGGSRVNAWLTHYFPAPRFARFRPSDPRLDEIEARYEAENRALARRYFPDHAASFIGVGQAPSGRRPLDRAGLRGDDAA